MVGVPPLRRAGFRGGRLFVNGKAQGAEGSHVGISVAK